MNKYQKKKSRMIRAIMSTDRFGQMTYKEAKRKFRNAYPAIMCLRKRALLCHELECMWPQIIVPPGNTAREDLFHGGFTSPPLISILPHDSRSPEDVFGKLIEEESL